MFLIWIKQYHGTNWGSGTKNYEIVNLFCHRIGRKVSLLTPESLNLSSKLHSKNVQCHVYKSIYTPQWITHNQVYIQLYLHQENSTSEANESVNIHCTENFLWQFCRPGPDKLFGVSHQRKCFSAVYTHQFTGL